MLLKMKEVKSEDEEEEADALRLPPVESMEWRVSLLRFPSTAHRLTAANAQMDAHDL